MIFYFAGADSFPERLGSLGVKNILISMATDCEAISHIPKYFPSGVRLMLDSGAYTFQSKGYADIDVWLERVFSVRNNARELISYDVIGDGQKTYEYYLYVSKYLPDVIPVFHQYSDFKYLDCYLDRTDRIALGGMVGSGSRKVYFLKKVFKRKIVRYHGFGLSSQPLLMLFPFYSVDSTSWLNGCRYGSYYTFKNGKLSAWNGPKRERVEHYMHYLDAARSSIFSFMEFERFITGYWKQKGIVWKN
jgi:hypothetical protein